MRSRVWLVDEQSIAVAAWEEKARALHTCLCGEEGGGVDVSLFSAECICKVAKTYEYHALGRKMYQRVDLVHCCDHHHPMFPMILDLQGADAV